MGCATDGLQVSYEEKSVLSLYVLSPEHPWQGKENPALVLPPLDVRFGSYIYQSLLVKAMKNTQYLLAFKALRP